MSSFNIEEYINSLPDDTETIDVLNKSLTYLPSLKRFHKLKKLYCSYNQLTSLPELNDSLQELYCSNNQLTSLPELNHSLQSLYCSYNQLTSLPELNDSLQRLYCSKNQLTSLPELNHSLQKLYCSYNQLTSLPELNHSLQELYCDHNQFSLIINHIGFLTNEHKNILNNKIKTLHRFRLLFWSLKYKKQFRDWLWLKVRLPKIEQMYHPNKLNELLNESEMNEEELDNVFSNW